MDGKWMATGTKKYKEARAELRRTFSHFPLGLVPPKPFQPRLNQPCPPWGNRIGDLEMYAAYCSYPKPQSCGQHCCGFLLHSKHSKPLSLVKKEKIYKPSQHLAEQKEHGAWPILQFTSSQVHIFTLNRLFTLHFTKRSCTSCFYARAGSSNLITQIVNDGNPYCDNTCNTNIQLSICAHTYVWSLPRPANPLPPPVEVGYTLHTAY